MRLVPLPFVGLLIAIVLAGCARPTPERPAPATSSPAATPLAVGLRYTCGQLPFDPIVLEQAGSAEQGIDPAAAALRELITGPDGDGMLPETGWILVGAIPGSAEYIAPTLDGLVFVALAQTGGVWQLGATGPCTPIAAIDGGSIATWSLSLDVPQPHPTSTQFTAEVTERACTGGRPMGQRLMPPLIQYGETEVIVVFAAQPLAGAHDCPGNPSQQVVVELGEPLGERVLMDGAFYPPRDAEAPLQ